MKKYILLIFIFIGIFLFQKTEASVVDIDSQTDFSTLSEAKDAETWFGYQPLKTGAWSVATTTVEVKVINNRSISGYPYAKFYLGNSPLVASVSSEPSSIPANSSSTVIFTFSQSDIDNLISNLNWNTSTSTRFLEVKLANGYPQYRGSSDAGNCTQGVFGWYNDNYLPLSRTPDNNIDCIYYKITRGTERTLAINFPANEEETHDFDAFRLAWNVEDYESYPNHYAQINLILGTNQTAITNWTGQGSGYQNWPNTWVLWNTWNDITEIKDPAWIMKGSREIPQTGTYYAKAILFFINEDNYFDFEEIAVSPVIAFDITTGNVYHNYWEYTYPTASTTLPTFLETASSTFFLDISDVNSPFYVDCSAYDGQSFFSSSTINSLVCHTEKIGKEILWTVLVKWPKEIAVYFADAFNYIIFRFQSTFPLNVIYTFNQVIQNIQASSTPNLVLSGGNAFGGRSFTILTASTTNWIESETGFDYKNVINKIFYGITGVIILISSINLVKKVYRGKEENE